MLAVQPVSSLRRLFLAFAPIGFLWGCMETPEPPPPNKVPFGEHRTEAYSGPASKGVGEDCERYGRAECKSGLCIHTVASAAKAYVCSQSCEAPGDCPSGWSCTPAGLGGVQAMCVPQMTQRGGKQ